MWRSWPARAVSSAGRGAEAGGRRVTVTGIDRNEQGLKRAAGRHRARGGRPARPGRGPQPRVDRIAAAAGPPEVLVNTIGTYRLGDALSVTPEDLRSMIDVNLGSALWLTQAVVPYMRERGPGSIVHVASRPGLEPNAWQASYAPSKATLAYVTRMLDLELRLARVPGERGRAQLLTSPRPASSPRGRTGHAVTPEALADVLVYHASDAATPVSGAVLAAYDA